MLIDFDVNGIYALFASASFRLFSPLCSFPVMQSCSGTHANFRKAAKAPPVSSSGFFCYRYLIRGQWGRHVSPAYQIIPGRPQWCWNILNTPIYCHICILHRTHPHKTACHYKYLCRSVVEIVQIKILLFIRNSQQRRNLHKLIVCYWIPTV